MSKTTPEAEVFTLADLRSWKETPPGWKDEDKPILAVFGDPVSHSLSPQMMNPALEARGIPGRYIRLEIKDEEFEEGLRLLPELGFVGTNVTIPHKFRALQNVDEVSADARRLGAVNTVIVEEDKSLSGFNSDGPGFLQTVREAFQIDVSQLRIMIFGAGGGAGRAVAIQCAMETCDRLVLVNRTHEKAEKVVAEVSSMLEDDRLQGPVERLEAIPWEDKQVAEQLENIDLIVNATSLGMKRTDPEVLPGRLIQPHHLVVDMVYRPLETPLLAQAEAAGARGINGLAMLLHQGVISFEMWFGGKAPLDVMRESLEKSI